MPKESSSKAMVPPAYKDVDDRIITLKLRNSHSEVIPFGATTTRLLQHRLPRRVMKWEDSLIILHTDKLTVNRWLRVLRRNKIYLWAEKEKEKKRCLNCGTIAVYIADKNWLPSILAICPPEIKVEHTWFMIIELFLHRMYYLTKKI